MAECPICFKKADYTTKCNHHFCKKCLYKWGYSCPLCRQHVTLDYPNTRAMSRSQHVIDNTQILLQNVARVKETKYKIQYAEKLFQFLWDWRVVVRKHGELCRTIHERSAHIKKECLDLGIVPPKIINKTITI